VYLRGKATERLESLDCAPGFGAHARRCVSRVFTGGCGQAQRRQRSRIARGGDASAETDVGRSLGSTRHVATSDGAHANIVAASFTNSRAEA
jgi:hypothetical protein